MNTDARRAVFCAVMGAEDCMDAFERLLKLQLKARCHFCPRSQRRACHIHSPRGALHQR